MHCVPRISCLFPDLCISPSRIISLKARSLFFFLKDHGIVMFYFQLLDDSSDRRIATSRIKWHCSYLWRHIWITEQHGGASWRGTDSRLWRHTRKQQIDDSTRPVSWYKQCHGRKGEVDPIGFGTQLSEVSQSWRMPCGLNTCICVHQSWMSRKRLLSRGGKERKKDTKSFRNNFNIFLVII